MYSRVYADFAGASTSGVPIKLFDGPPNQLRPVCTAEARSSGLFKVLGSMVAHSICQDGIGFPYLSPACYWYIISGEDKALQFVGVENLPADSASIVSSVSFIKLVLSSELNVLILFYNG